MSRENGRKLGAILFEFHEDPDGIIVTTKVAVGSDIRRGAAVIGAFKKSADECVAHMSANLSAALLRRIAESGAVPVDAELFAHDDGHAVKAND